jgi:hypothetical protein
LKPIAKLASAESSLPVAGDGSSLQPSRLFSSLFRNIDPAKKIFVLEAGPASESTIRFFGQYKSRIHILNLFSETLIRERQGELSENEMKLEFHNLLNLKVGTLIDTCLFWDFLNYLSRPALRAFSAALRPYIHAGTQGHGFTVLNIETPLKNQQYGIHDPETLSVRPGRRSQLGYHPHSHEELNAAFSCFEIGRGWLLPDGRLEILLKAKL